MISTSFHGRDIFAPAAAHLARGVAIEALGPSIDPATLVPSPIAAPAIEQGTLRSSIVYIDTFGSVKLAGLRTDLEAALGPVRPGDEIELALDDRDVIVPWVAAFGDVAVGAALLYEDSYGRICLAENQGSAAQRLGLREDAPVVIRRA